MGLFDLFARRPALSEGLEQYRNTSGRRPAGRAPPRRNTGTATCPERKTCPWIGWIPSPSLPGAHCLSTAAAGRGAPRPKPGWRGRGIPLRIWGACWATAGRWKHREGSSMKVVIIGGVPDGATAAARLRRLDERAEIIILERTGYVPMPTAACPTMWAV